MKKLSNKFNNEDFKLCYISGQKAFFTTMSLNEQWGDDWNDAPYEHNAEPPYENEEHEIISLYFETDLQTPADIAGCNSNYSVEMINSGAIAWLTSPSWGEVKKSIHAGTNIEDFIKLIISEPDGKVYVPYLWL